MPEVWRTAGVVPRLVYRWRAEGGLTERAADTIAVRAGFHPGYIWPEWWAVDGGG